VLRSREAEEGAQGAPVKSFALWRSLQAAGWGSVPGQRSAGAAASPEARRP